MYIIPKNFYKEDDKLSFHIGCSNYRSNREFVWVIEAARSLCGAADDVALDLLRMAVEELERAESVRKAKDKK